jgi:hypothetical protein
MAARLEGLSSGNNVIISHALYNDPEVRALVDSGELEASQFDVELKGFEKERFELWRVARKAKSAARDLPG